VAGLFILVAVAFITYWEGMHIPYYSDDYQLVLEDPGAKIFYYFTHNNPALNFYRPIQGSFMAVTQALFGLETWPIRMVQLLLHAGLAWFVYLFMRHYGFNNLAAILAVLFLVVSQANAHAILSNDTFSQVAGSFFGYGSVLFLYLGSCRPTEIGGTTVSPSKTYLALSVIGYTIALLSKETSVAFLPLIVALIIHLRSKHVVQEGAVRRSVLLISLFLVITLLYLVVRGLIVPAQPHLGASRYDYRLGGNVIKNSALFLAAATIPASSVTAFVAMKVGNVYQLLLIALSTLVFVTGVAYGLWLSRLRTLSLVLGVSAAVTVAPVIFLNKVSELYVYNAMPIICVLFGIGLAQLVKTPPLAPGRLIIVMLIALFALMHTMAVRDKALLMRKQGEKASTMLAQILTYVDRVPPSGRLILANPSTDEPEYSVYLMNGFNLFIDCKHIINQFSKRSDFEVRITQMGDITTEQLGFDTVVLTVDDNADANDQPKIIQLH
jgi:hypothetical protein